MSRRTIMSLAASAIIGIGFMLTDFRPMRPHFAEAASVQAAYEAAFTVGASIVVAFIVAASTARASR